MYVQNLTDFSTAIFNVRNTLFVDSQRRRLYLHVMGDLRILVLI